MTSRFILPFSDVGNGISPSNGAKLFFEVTGGGSDRDTFSNQAGTIANANPVIADADGRFSTIYISGSYKVILKDKNDVLQWEEDPITSTSETVDLVKIYTNVAAMVADTDVDVGAFVRTEGYFTAGDGGDNDYLTVAAATGTDDGVSFIDGATHQFKGLFPGGSVNSRQCGVTGDDVADDFTELANGDIFANANNKRFIILSGTHKMSTGRTFVSDLEIYENGILKPDSGDTVTISGPLTAGFYQIFDGDGTISFGTSNPHIGEHPIEWYGVNTTNADTVNDVGMARMAAAVPFGATIRVGNGEYTITDFTHPNKRWTWLGTASIETTETTVSSTIKGTSGSAAPTITMPFTGVNTSRFTLFKNLRILTAGTGTALFIDNLGTNLQNVYLGGGAKGGHISHATDLHWLDVYSIGSAQGLFLNPSSGRAITSSLFTNVVSVCANQTGDALLLSENTSSGSIVGNTFINHVAQSARRGIVLTGIGPARNTFINPWTEAIAGSSPVALEDADTSNSIFITPDFRDNRTTVPVNYGATTTRYDQGFWTMVLPVVLIERTVATLDSASVFDNGIVIVSDETGGRTIATSDGTNWRRVSDGAIVS